MQTGANARQVQTRTSFAERLTVRRLTAHQGQQPSGRRPTATSPKRASSGKQK